MGLAAYMGLTRPKYSVPETTEIMHCQECQRPQETLCRWEREPKKWVCPDCFGELKDKTKGESHVK